MLEQQIKEEIREWSRHALEDPSPLFNNLPACPYAKKAWSDDEVGFVFKTETDNLPLYKTIAGFNDKYKLILVVDLAYKKDPDEFEDFLYDLNEAIAEGMFAQKDMWVMGIHPDDNCEELLNDGSFSPLVDKRYAIIFVQRLKYLHQKAEALKPLGYYDEAFKCVENNALYAQRETLYRRLIDGNETT